MKTGIWAASNEILTIEGLVRAAWGCYALRKLNSAYGGNCLKVRRSTDNVTQDIGWSGNEFDEGGMLSFLGSASGFVDTWYDQSGNGNHVSQASTSFQPRIVLSGVTETLNSLPTVFFNGSSFRLQLTTSAFNSKPYCFSAVNQAAGTGTSNWFTGTSPGTSNQGLQIGYDGVNSFKIAQWNNDQSFSATWSTNTPYVWTGKKHPNGGSDLWRTLTYITRGTNPSSVHLSGSTTFFVGAGGTPSMFNGKMSELIIWNTKVVSSHQLLLVAANQKARFGI